MGDTCGASEPRMWIIAASGGRLCIFERRGAQLVPCTSSRGTLLHTPNDCTRRIQSECAAQSSDQFIIIGSPNDLHWLHASLPVEAENRIVAEIPAPLDASWFLEPTLGRLNAQLIAYLS